MKKMLSVVAAGLVAASLFVACDDGGSKTGSKPVNGGLKVPENAVRNFTAALADEYSDWVVVGVEDLQKLSEVVNSGTYAFSGDTISLLNDITINEKVLADDFTEPQEVEPGVPAEGLVNLDSIGMRGKEFSGTFDGCGHIISGLYMYQGHQGLGFIGGSKGATLQNLIILDACVINMNTKGADDDDDDRFGGLVGWVDGTTKTTIENCVFVGVIGSEAAKGRGSPYEYLGGLIGYCNTNADAENCLIVAKIIGSGDVVNEKCNGTLNRTDVTGIELSASTYAEVKEQIDEMIEELR